MTDNKIKKLKRLITDDDYVSKGVDFISEFILEKIQQENKNYENKAKGK